MNNGFKIVLVGAYICAIKHDTRDNAKATNIRELSTLQKAKNTRQSSHNLRDISGIYGSEHSDKLITFTNINNGNCIR